MTKEQAVALVVEADAVAELACRLRNGMDATLELRGSDALHRQLAELAEAAQTLADRVGGALERELGVELPL